MIRIQEPTKHIRFSTLLKRNTNTSHQPTCESAVFENSHRFQLYICRVKEGCTCSFSPLNAQHNHTNGVASGILNKQQQYKLFARWKLSNVFETMQLFFEVHLTIVELGATPPGISTCVEP